MKKSKRLRKIYYTAPNGIKIDTRCVFPDQELVGVTVHEPLLNIALTDELRAKGSVEVEFNFGKEGR